MGTKRKYKALTEIENVWLAKKRHKDKLTYDQLREQFWAHFDTDKTQHPLPDSYAGLYAGSEA